jgi:hypothetical protein
MIDDMQHAGEDDVDGVELSDETPPPAETWVDRLVAESVELHQRLTQLRTFMGTDTYATLPWQDKDALDRQQQHMAAYAGVLDERLSRAPHDDISGHGEALRSGEPGNRRHRWRKRLTTTRWRRTIRHGNRSREK